MKSNRPVNLSLGQVLSVNKSSPVAMASILHRASGLILFLLIPALLCLLQCSLSSPEGFAEAKAFCDSIIFRLTVGLFLAGLVYHLFMGVKHLLADMGFAEELKSGRLMATVMLCIAIPSSIAAFFWVVL